MQLKRMRNIQTDVLYTAYVVVGDGPNAGNIKTVRFARNVEPGEIVQVNWAGTDAAGFAPSSVDVGTKFRKRGWKLLRDMYEEESNERGYDVWLSFQEACQRGMVEPGEQFPDEWLPRKVLAMRGASTSIANRWKAPEKKADAKPAKA